MSVGEEACACDVVGIGAGAAAGATCGHSDLHIGAESAEREAIDPRLNSDRLAMARNAVAQSHVMWRDVGLGLIVSLKRENCVA